MARCPWGWRALDRAIAVGLFLLIVTVGAIPAARAVEIDAEGLRLDLGIAPHCLILPRALQVPDDCPGIDLEAATAAVDAQAQMGATLIRWMPADGPVVTMFIVPTPAIVPTRADVANMLAGFYNSMHAGDHVTKLSDPRLEHQTSTVAGTPAIVYSSDAKAGPPGDRVVSYFVFGAKHMYTFAFQASDERAMRAFADRVMATVELPPLSVEEQARMTEEGPARSIAAKTGALLGSLVGAFLITGLLSRIILRFSGRTYKGAIVAFGMTAVITLGITSITMGGRSVIYVGPILVWLLIDIARVARQGTV